MSIYYRRTEKLYRQIHDLVEAHRKWVKSKSAPSLFDGGDADFLDAVMGELSIILRALELGEFPAAYEKAERAARARIRSLMGRDKPWPEPADHGIEG